MWRDRRRDGAGRSAAARRGARVARVPSPPSTRRATTPFFVGAVERSRSAGRATPLVYLEAGVPRSVIEAVVFDLDGVLIQTEEIWDDVREDLRAGERGGALRRRGAAGDDGHELARVVALHARRARRAGRPEEISAEVVRRMEARYRERLPLIDGAAGRGRAARRRGGRSGSRRPRTGRSSTPCSSSPGSPRALPGDGLLGGGRRAASPRPDVYLEGARRLGVDPPRAPRSRTRTRASAARRRRGCASSRSRTRATRPTTRRSPRPTSSSGRSPSSHPKLSTIGSEPLTRRYPRREEDAAVVPAEAHRVRERDVDLASRASFGT